MDFTYSQYVLTHRSIIMYIYVYIYVYVLLHRYLCEYIYFKSLCINKDQTIFIHVPILDQENTVKKLAEQLKCIIKKLLAQVI